MITAFEEEQEISSGIVLWSGSLSNIPSGWVLCDGNNGTPDLTHQFTKGTTSSTKEPNASGGKDSISPSVNQLPSHTHSGSTGTSGSHTHTGANSSNSLPYLFDANNNPDSRNGLSEDSGDKEQNTGGSGTHSHSLSVDYTGGGGSYDNRPAFYEIAYIMKL